MAVPSPTKVHFNFHQYLVYRSRMGIFEKQISNGVDGGGDYIK